MGNTKIRYSETFLAFSIACSGYGDLPENTPTLTQEGANQATVIPSDYRVNPHQADYIQRFVKFMDLAETWKRSTAFYSSLDQIVTDPAYLQIIKMGRPMIPILLSEMKKQPDYWFTALKSITRADPVLNKHRGNLKKMAEDWINWGEKEGYS